MFSQQEDTGARYIEINSALVSAQNRQRFYVHNCGDVQQPEDRGILLKDILETGFTDREKSRAIIASCGRTTEREYFLKNQGQVALEQLEETQEPASVGYRGRLDEQGKWQKQYEAREDGKANAITTATTDSMIAEPKRFLRMDRKTKCGEGSLEDRMFNPNPRKQQVDLIAEPIKCLTEAEMDYMVRDSKGNYSDRWAFLNRPGEDDKSQCVVANIAKGVPYNVCAEPVRVGTYPNEAKNQEADSQQYRVYSEDGKSVTLCGNGGGMGAKTGLYAIPADPNGKQYPIYEVRDGKITIKGKQYPIKLLDGYYIIRKLTVTECCRLQTLPDDFCRAVSNSQAYKGLGNGWTAEVIIHILWNALKNVPKDEEIVVLSMYDGIGTGRYCLDKMGFKNVKYYAYEIDKYAIKVATSNYPDIIECGDAFQLREDDWHLPD